jgi:hypothetical protein
LFTSPNLSSSSSLTIAIFFFVAPLAAAATIFLTRAGAPPVARD